jgi:hypothetical protein
MPLKAERMPVSRLFKKINQSSILEHLGGMPKDSEHCALLAAKTFHKALRDYAIGKKR